MIIDKVFIQIRASVTYMEYGQAKWIIHPLRIKVRLMKPKDWKEIQIHSNYAIDDTDYAGVEHLKLMLDDLQYYDDGKDLAPYQIEPLDPDWKSKHMDHCRDQFGHPSDYTEWFCEINSWSWGSVKDRDSFFTHLLNQIFILIQKFEVKFVKSQFINLFPETSD